MDKKVSRRDFIKSTSISAAGVSAMSLVPLSSGFAHSNQDKSRVVIATDEKCYVNGKVEQNLVQDMVDYSIMTLTGKKKKVEAYESLFPDGLTKDTKIIIKYNAN